MDTKFGRLAFLTLLFIDGEISVEESTELDEIVSRDEQHRELFEQILELRPIIKFIRRADQIKFDHNMKQIYNDNAIKAHASLLRRARRRRILIKWLVVLAILGLGVSLLWAGQ